MLTCLCPHVSLTRCVVRGVERTRLGSDEIITGYESKYTLTSDMETAICVQTVICMYWYL